VPGAEVGQGPNRVELGEVEEMDEDGARGGQPVARLHRSADPVQAGGDGGDGYVGSRGTQAPEGMLPASPRYPKEWLM